MGKSEAWGGTARHPRPTARLGAQGHSVPKRLERDDGVDGLRGLCWALSPSQEFSLFGFSMSRRGRETSTPSGSLHRGPPPSPLAPGHGVLVFKGASRCEPGTSWRGSGQPGSVTLHLRITIWFSCARARNTHCAGGSQGPARQAQRRPRAGGRMHGTELRVTDKRSPSLAHGAGQGAAGHSPCGCQKPTSFQRRKRGFSGILSEDRPEPRCKLQSDPR